MNFFGPRPWGPALDEPETMVATPVGAECNWCGEAIAEGESGVIMPFVRMNLEATTLALHRECHLRQIFGSVGHQQGTCSCFGGEREDPAEMTRRQAASAAVALFYAR
jgi:hypothetical protein